MTYATDELNELQREISNKSPNDVLQFCYEYFGAKLKDQRSHCWKIREEAKAKGIELFPKLNSEEQATFSGFSFKSPFAGSDPHSDHGNQSSGGSLFKGYGASNFSGQNRNTTTDPAGPDDIEKPTSTKNASSHNSGLNLGANRRYSVSSEAMNPDKFKLDSWTPPTNDLTEEQRNELGNTLSSNFLFTQLDTQSKKTVLSALTKKVFRKGDVIIKQGDEGDFFYIIESGTVDFYVNGNQVNSSGEGSSFGELALMYNAKRAATAVAVSETVNCWALDRLTFRRILLEGTFNKRLMYEDFLKDVKVLSGLSAHERSKLADALTTRIYYKGSEIVTEGEKGEDFYFIESGHCNVIKKGQGVVAKLTKGDYFGEVALLNDLPRQATVEAQDTVIVATLGKSGFTRLLGPAVDLLKRHDPTASH